MKIQVESETAIRGEIAFPPPAWLSPKRISTHKPLSGSPKTISVVKYTTFHIPFNAVKEERLQFRAAGRVLALRNGERAATC